MSEIKVSVVNLKKQTVYGLWKNSNDSTVSKDIKNLSKKYHIKVSSPGSKVFPYFVLSRNYNELSKDFEMFVGGTIDKKGLESLIIPNGEYARITIKPKLEFLWGLAIGEAKRYFYTKWLPKSRYSALNMEYEYHTEKSDGKSPEIDIFFAVKRK